MQTVPPSSLRPVPRGLVWGVLALAVYGAVALGRDGPALWGQLRALGRTPDGVVVGVAAWGPRTGVLVRDRTGNLQLYQLWGVAWPLPMRVPEGNREERRGDALWICQMMATYQPFWDRVVGREVIVVERPHHPGVIRVADLYLLDGTHINAWLVQSGLAGVGTPWREGEEEAVAALRPLMIEAALARRGLWHPDHLCHLFGGRE